MIEKNLGLKIVELKLKTNVNHKLRWIEKKLKLLKMKVNNPNLRKEERRLKMEALRLRMMNVVHVLAPTRKTSYLVQDVSGFSMPTLDGSMKTVLRTVQ